VFDHEAVMFKSSAGSRHWASIKYKPYLEMAVIALDKYIEGASDCPLRHNPCVIDVLYRDFERLAKALDKQASDSEGQ
jgi:hypothetical protein